MEEEFSWASTSFLRIWEKAPVIKKTEALSVIYVWQRKHRIAAYKKLPADELAIAPDGFVIASVQHLQKPGLADLHVQRVGGAVIVTAAVLVDGMAAQDASQIHFIGAVEQRVRLVQQHYIIIQAQRTHASILIGR